MNNFINKHLKNSKNEKEKNNESDYFISQNKILFKKYQVLKLIGTGTFSKVYSGLNFINNTYVAIKAEKRVNYGIQLLESEAFFLYSLRGYGIPEVLSYGKTQTYNILVMPLLGNSLLNKFIIKNKAVNINDICSVAIQILDRIEWIHSNNIVYRDIKPENFLFGRKDEDILYLIDFGLCKKYKSSKTGKHITSRNLGKFTGTSRYASINATSGNEQSRRDDIESIGYMIIFFMKKKLPWQNLIGDSYKNYYHKLYLMKKNIKMEVLCDGLPREIIYYMNYARALKFEQEPDYKYLKNLFKIILKRNNILYEEYILSWCQNEKSNNFEKTKSIYKRNSYYKLDRKSSPQRRLFTQIRKSIEKKNKTNNRSNNKENEKRRRIGYNIISLLDNSIKIKNEYNSEISSSLKAVINKNISTVLNGQNISNKSTIKLEHFDNKNNDSSIRNNKYQNNNNDFKNNYSLVTIKNNEKKNSNSYENNKTNNKVIPISKKEENKNRNLINISPYSYKGNNDLDINFIKNNQKKYNTINQIEIDNKNIKSNRIKNYTIKYNKKNTKELYNRYRTFNIINEFNNTIDKSINNNIIINNIYQRYLGNINNNGNYRNIKNGNNEKLISLIDISNNAEKNAKSLNNIFKKDNKNQTISNGMKQNTINNYSSFNYFKKNILKKNNNNNKIKIEKKNDNILNLTNLIYNTQVNQTKQNISNILNNQYQTTVKNTNKNNFIKKNISQNNNNANINKINNINSKILKSSENNVQENNNLNINKIKRIYNINNFYSNNSKNNVINNIINLNGQNINSLYKLQKSPNLYDKEINLNEKQSYINNNIPYNNNKSKIKSRKNSINQLYKNIYGPLLQEKSHEKNITPTLSYSSKDKNSQNYSILNNYINSVNQNNIYNIDTNNNTYNSFKNMNLNQNKDNKEYYSKGSSKVVSNYSSKNVSKPKDNIYLENERKLKENLNNRYFNDININYERKFKTEEVNIKLRKAKKL